MQSQHRSKGNMDVIMRGHGCISSIDVGCSVSADVIIVGPDCTRNIDNSDAGTA